MHVDLGVKPRTHVETRCNSKGWAYKPRQAVEYASMLEEAIDEAFHSSPLAGPLAVSIGVTKFGITIDVEEWQGPVSKLRGDVDNYVKDILDAGNGRIWKDDSQIQHLKVTKW